MSQANKALVRRHFEEIFNRQNLAACDELMGEDLVEHGVAPFAQSAPGRVNGPQAMRGTAAWLLGQFPDLQFNIKTIIAEGDMVAVRLLAEGTNLGPIGPMPPTGKRFATYASHWFRIADGKLVEHWATRDDLASFLQLGLIAPPGRPAA